jgi:hypothetical protein
MFFLIFYVILGVPIESLSMFRSPFSFAPNMEKFLSRPILPPDEIRMLEILPGRPEDPIHVRLFHKQLLEMPHCIALAYE